MENIVLKIFTLLFLGLSIGFGSYHLYNTYSLNPNVLSSSIDPVLLAAKCNEYALQNPGKQLPNVCHDIGLGGTSSPTPTSTIVPSPEPSGTPVPSPSAGSGGPTTSPTPSSSVVPQPGQPYADAPACPPEVHNKRKFHTLWNQERGCHYDHHHGDNPHELDSDSTFGTSLYAKMGGADIDISYPWQTFSDAGLENDLKHAGYFWHVRKDIPCTKGDPCITAFRTLVHQHPTGRDATVRYHSYVFEAKTSDGGYFLLGGWVDFGDLHSPEGTVIVDVQGNHDSRLGNGAGRHKQHTPTTGSIIWYGASQIRVDENYPRGFVTLSSTISDAWDKTDPNDPARSDDYICYGLVPIGRCRINATTLRPHLISINMIRDFDAIIRDPSDSQRASFDGYADRYGRPLAPGHGCTSYSENCAPMVMRNLRLGYNYQTADSHTALSFRDYDIYFGNLSAGWNQPVP